jgi:hypothetical protein
MYKQPVGPHRLLLLLAAAVAAAGLAAPAGGQVLISSGLLVGATAAETDISLSVGGGAGTAWATIVVPPGFEMRLDRPAGAKLGRADLSLDSAADPSGFGSQVSGDVVAVDPAAFANDAGIAACAPGRHLAAWRLEPLDLPVFVDRATGPEAALGGYQLRICFDLRRGLTLSGLSLELDRTIVPPSMPGLYTWRALVTPRTPSGAADAGGTYEARCVHAWPTVLTLRSRRIGPARRLLYGRLLLAGRPRAGATVRVIRYSSTSSEGSLTVTIGQSLSARTDRAGRFRARVRLRRTTAFYALWFAFPRESCSSPSAAPGGCVSESISPAVSRPLVVRRRR